MVKATEKVTKLKKFQAQIDANVLKTGWRIKKGGLDMK